MSLHKEIQNHILSLLPEGEAHLEEAFPGHYADVYWEPEKIVFEVQCSPISLEVAKKRCEDYEALGVQPVWLLHTKTFNRCHLSLAERFLRTQTCYYTNFFPGGYSSFFDQFEIIVFAKRAYRSRPLPINIAKPKIINNTLTFSGDRHLLHHDERKHYLSIRKYFRKDARDELKKRYKKFLLKTLRTLNS